MILCNQMLKKKHWQRFTAQSVSEMLDIITTPLQTVKPYKFSESSIGSICVTCICKLNATIFITGWCIFWLVVDVFCCTDWRNPFNTLSTFNVGEPEWGWHRRGYRWRVRRGQRWREQWTDHHVIQPHSTPLTHRQQWTNLRAAHPGGWYRIQDPANVSGKSRKYWEVLQT